MGAASVLTRCSVPGFHTWASQWVGDACRVVVCESGEEVRTRLCRERPQALLIDPLDIEPSEDDVLRVAHQLYPDLPVALIAPSNSGDCFAFLRMYGLGAVVPPRSNRPPRQMRFFFDHMTAPTPASGLGDYFPPGHPIARRRITSPGMRGEVFAAMASDLTARGHVDNHDLRLVFEEALNNAVFHAFRTEKNAPKYAGNGYEAFDEEDVIEVTWAGDNEMSVLAISDNRGFLAPSIVWDRLFRQTSLTGLLDTSGRGLYLVHLLSRMLLVTIRPGQRTEVSAFFGAGSEREESPISVRVVPPFAPEEV
jgi:hypothetical protein